MISALTRVLIKIFVKGFYRVHAGLLLFSSITFFMYFFFIEVLNQNHLSPGQRILYNLIFVLTLLSSPVMVALVFTIWLLFTIKSWNYITRQILISNNQFIFYSVTSYDKIKQFKSWFTVQLALSFPLIVYGTFTLIVGVIFGYYIAPIVILLYTLLLSAVSAFIYVRHTNTPISAGTKPVLFKIIGNWKKPFYSLFIYHIFDKLKVGLIVTKLLSYGIITVGIYLLAEEKDDLRIAGITTLGIIVAHSILIYHSYKFENLYLGFSRNFPYKKGEIYFNWIVTYLLLTLPENIWIITRFSPATSSILLVFNLGTGMLFRNLLYIVTLNMKKFIYCIFYLFVLFFITILFKLLWLLVSLNLLISIIVFNRNYYRQKDFIEA